MATKKASEETIVDVAEVYSKTETFINDNGKTLTYIVLGIVAVILGFFMYKKFVQEPKAQEAAERIWKAEYYFEKDSFQLALDGTAEHLGFLEVSEEYSGTAPGNLATYYAGVCYLNLEDFPAAIEYMEKAHFDDIMVEATRLGALGDAHVQTGDLNGAADYYSKAVTHSDNDFTAPIFLKKLALVYEDLGEKGKAFDAYTRLKNDYSTSTVARDIDKYIGRVAPFVD